MTKNIVLGLVCALLGFGTGWFLKPAVEVSPKALKSEITEEKTPESTKEKVEKNAETTVDELPDFDASETDFSKTVTGKFVMKGADWAGFDFRSRKEIYWTAELFPNDPDICSLRWIDKSTFVIYRESNSDQCPPIINLFRVMSYNGKKLVIRELSASGIFKDEDTEYFPVDDEFNSK